MIPDEVLIRQSAHVEGIGPCEITAAWKATAYAVDSDCDSWVAVFTNHSSGDVIVTAHTCDDEGSTKRSGYMVATPERAEIIRQIRRVAKTIEYHALGEECIDELPRVEV